MNLIVADTREQASQQAGQRVTAALERALATSPRATFIASGGDTPVECYQYLSRTPAPWGRVDVTPTDERDVPLSSQERNSRLLRHILQQKAARNCTVHEIDQFDALSQPAAVTLLGMGEDGHFASIFPDINNLHAVVDLSTRRRTFKIQTAANPALRTTLSLSALCHTKLIILLAFGEKKLSVIEHPQGLPIEHVFKQLKTPVEIIWSP